MHYSERTRPTVDAAARIKAPSAALPMHRDYETRSRRSRPTTDCVKTVID